MSFMISRAAQPLDADTERELVAKGANRLRMMSLLETHHEKSAIARATANHVVNSCPYAGPR